MPVPRQYLLTATRKKSRCVVSHAGSNGLNNIWYKVVFKGGVYETREAVWASAGQKLTVWRRWKAGQTLHESGRAFGKEHSCIRCLVSRHGGTHPVYRTCVR